MKSSSDPIQFQLLLLTLFELTSMTSQTVKHESSAPYFNPEHSFVSGRTVQYLPSPIFYDTYIPILFKIPIPKHTNNALRLNWSDVHSCEKPSGDKFCPISYHLFQVINKLGDDMGFWKPYYVNHTSTKKESLKKRTGFEVICNEISPHFFRSYTNKHQFESYVRAMRACSRMGAHSFHLVQPKENWVVDKTVYYKMLDSYKSKYFMNLPTKGKTDWAIFLNTYASVNGLLLANHVMESVRLGTAHRICQQGLIPETFVSMDMLKAALENVTQSLKKWGYELIYPDLVHDLEEYYKLPIADCTFSDEYSFFIRILAPVRRSDLTYNLIEINTIPFLKDLSESSGIPQSLCRLTLPASKLTLIEASTGLLLDTSCEPNKLCKTSEVLNVFENDACTSALLTDDPKIISGTCKFSCFSLDSHALPIIRRVSPDTYVVVGTSNMKIHLNCFDKPRELVPVVLKNLGAIKIKLACNCQILYLNHVSYRPRDPCGGKTSVEHILPYHWFSRTLNITVEMDKYETPSTTTTTTTTTTTSTTVPPPPEPPKPQTTPDSPKPTDEDVQPGPDPTKEVEVLTIAPNTDGESEGSEENEPIIESPSPPEFSGDIDDKQIEKSIENQENELTNIFRRRGTLHEETCHGTMSDGLMAQLIILWILVLTLGIVIVYMSYQLKSLMKWRELQAYKDTRIVYRIPPETPPDDTNKIIRDGSSGGVRVAWDAFYDLFNVR